MSKYRQAARVDDNQREIVSSLEKIPGVNVALGKDDIFVGHNGFNYWYEIKNPDKKLKRKDGFVKGAIKDGQAKLRREWPGHYRIISSLEEILEDMGLRF